MGVEKRPISPQEGKARPWVRIGREYGESILIAVFLALILRTFVIQAFKIPSASMEPTLLIGDHILVSKFIYGIEIPFAHIRLFPVTRPKRGDVVVFITPEDKDKGYWDQRDFIKRVIGVEGDMVEVKDKIVYINGRPWNDTHGVHTDPDLRPGRDNFGPITVPKNSLFMMGDNRDHSNDSRYWGFAGMSDVQGKALIIYWSWDGQRHMPRWGRLFHLIH